MITDSIELEYFGLKKEDYYETNSVSKGKEDYYCHLCNKIISKGTASDVHKFYPEFQSYRTHPLCSDKFLKTL